MTDKNLPRRTHGWREATRDPIYVLEVREWIWMGLPDGWEVGDDGVLVPDGTHSNEELIEEWPEAESEEGSLYLWPSAIYERMEGELFHQTWNARAVFFTREEGEAWAKARDYNYGSGWRIFCMCAEGELAKILKALTDRESRE